MPTRTPNSVRRTIFVALILLATLPAAPGAVAQPVPQESPVSSMRPRLRAVRLAEAPKLDGNVRSDPAWRSVEPVGGFVQTQPFAGDPASEATEIRVGFTGDTLYVAAVLHDREPTRLIVSDTRRDSPLDDADAFSFILDTYRDAQNGFVFGTNPAAIEYDAQVSGEGMGGWGTQRQSMGTGAGFNINWDGAWRVRTETGEYGWSAEFAIPFKTLRYPSGAVQEWGVNFQRNIRRRNERAYWAPLPRQFNLYRVSMAGRLDGVEVPFRRSLTVIPYVSGSVNGDWQTLPGDVNRGGDLGGDLKFGVSPSMTLDATVNTDFAQVEVDEQQVNLDRFSLFFPEKRPFFLENSGLFAVGESSEVELFFSRRIGLDEGRTVPITGGLRLSGQEGDTKIGLLSMQTGTVGGVVPSSLWSVARVQQELPNRSALGFLVTSRDRTSDAEATTGPATFNRVAALDGRLGIGTDGRLTGFVARSFSPGGEREPWAWYMDLQKDTEHWLVQASVTQVARDFNPEVGFLRRTDYRKVSSTVLRRIRPDEVLGLQELRPHVSYRGYWGLDGFHETGYLHIDNHFEWRGGWELHTGVNVTREGVRAPFDIATGVTVPAQTYDHSEVMLVGITDRGRPVSLEVRTTIGGFFGGDRVTVAPTLRVRGGDALTGELGVSYNDVTLPGGTFTTNLVRVRLSYSFTPRMYAQALVQVNDQADLWSANVRFGWLQDANSGLFVVYNQSNTLGAAFDEALVRGLTLKYSRRFDA